jgi:hypothetical protein
MQCLKRPEEGIRSLGPEFQARSLTLSSVRADAALDHTAVYMPPFFFFFKVYIFYVYEYTVAVQMVVSLHMVVGN